LQHSAWERSWCGSFPDTRVSAQDSGACAPAISAGHTYTVTAWYKSTVQPYFFLYYRNSAGSWVYWTQSAKLAIAGSWTQASFTTPVVPAGVADHGNSPPSIIETPQVSTRVGQVSG
jgi:hypothetical protein